MDRYQHNEKTTGALMLVTAVLMRIHDRKWACSLAEASDFRDIHDIIKSM